MKSRVSVLAVALVACAGASETSTPGDGGSGGQRQASGGGTGTSGKPSSGAAGTKEAGGSGGAASSGRDPSGGADASAGTFATGGITVATGGSATGGESVMPGEAGSGGAPAGSGGAAGGEAGAGAVDPISSAGGPCDIYASENTPCAAAYSTVRALLQAYDGPLYQVRRADGETTDIGLLATGGFADAAAQDAFCGDQACTISVMYDHSGHGNHLTRAPMDCYLGTASAPSNESDAKGRALKVGGHDVYSLYMISQDGYRVNDTSGMPTGDEPQGIYEVVDGKRVGTACCWDFGNGSTNNCAGPVGTANALFFGTAYWGKGAGDGPWFMADFENGVWSGGNAESSAQNPNLPSIDFDYAFGVLKTRSASYTIRLGNAQAGDLTTAYDGAAPHAFQMQGGVVLGLSSDASDSSHGTFFEGAITKGRPSNAVDNAVLKNVQAAGYGH